MVTGQTICVAYDMWKNDFGGPVGIAVNRGGIASDQVEEAMHLALRVVESSGTCPAVGATVDGFIAVMATNPIEFGRDDVERLIPRQLNKGICSALAACPCACISAGVKPPLSESGARDPQRAIYGTDQGLPDR